MNRRWKTLTSRYTKNRRQPQKESSTRRTQLPLERTAPVKMRSSRRPRFNIILLAVVIILGYFGIAPFINPTSVESNPVIKSGGDAKIVYFPIIS